ncbi:hypothetical protein BpHYR1_039743 [Brachionus plicatilis]|uniref:Uncharacterized protein n=1 Tax=Brachionus plicatilis TaxID=10195 RepID=A0A3M7T6B2_BRAPC|nr:hypothetical protein BpHYR1_039743 [Brachionus plicatilis]
MNNENTIYEKKVSRSLITIYINGDERKTVCQQAENLKIRINEFSDLILCPFKGYLHKTWKIKFTLKTITLFGYYRKKSHNLKSAFLKN